MMIRALSTDGVRDVLLTLVDRHPDVAARALADCARTWDPDGTDAAAAREGLPMTSTSALVYLITHAGYGAAKVGVSDPLGSRIAEHRRAGWELVASFKVAASAACAIEADILRWWRGELGLPPHLGRDQMPQGGWTETVATGSVDLAATVTRICNLAMQQDARPVDVLEAAIHHRDRLVRLPSASLADVRAAAEDVRQRRARLSAAVQRARDYGTSWATSATPPGSPASPPTNGGPANYDAEPYIAAVADACQAAGLIIADYGSDDITRATGCRHRAAPRRGSGRDYRDVRTLGWDEQRGRPDWPAEGPARGADQHPLLAPGFA